MMIKFFGTRGSIPSPGPGTVRYGGNTTCVQLVSKGGDLIIIDSGTGIRKLGIELSKMNNMPHIHLFLTHSHWDHIQGFPFFLPAYLPKTSITIYGCPPAYTKLQEILSNQMESQYFPVKFKNLKANINFENFCRNKRLQIKSLLIETIENYHPGTAYALKFVENKKVFVFMTDNELSLNENSPTSWEEFKEFCKDADCFIHDAQWDEDELPKKKGWGHSSYKEALKLALDSNAKQFYLFHHDPDRLDFQIDKFVQGCREIIKKKGRNTYCDAAREGAKLIL